MEGCALIYRISQTDRSPPHIQVRSDGSLRHRPGRGFYGYRAVFKGTFPVVRTDLEVCTQRVQVGIVFGY